MLGERLIKIRKELRFSGRGLAKLLGIAPTALIDYERDSKVPGGNVLAAYAYMGFNVNWILTGSGDMRTQQGTSSGMAFNGSEWLSLFSRLNLHQLCLASLQGSQGRLMQGLDCLESLDGRKTAAEVAAELRKLGVPIDTATATADLNYLVFLGAVLLETKRNKSVYSVVRGSVIESRELADQAQTAIAAITMLTTDVVPKAVSKQPTGMVSVSRHRVPVGHARVIGAKLLEFIKGISELDANAEESETINIVVGASTYSTSQ